MGYEKDRTLRSRYTLTTNFFNIVASAVIISHVIRVKGRYVFSLFLAVNIVIL